MENKFKVGDLVAAKINPDVKLKIYRYLEKVYYCRLESGADLPIQAYFEREIEKC
jgi:hypothetical protein